MSGFELILSAALCLSCAHNESDSLPPGLILLDDHRHNAAGRDNVAMLPSDVGLPETTPTASDIPIYGMTDEVKKLRTYVNGRHFRIATLEDYPLSYTQVLQNGTRVGLGVSFEVIDLLRKKFNFTYDVVVPRSNIIGSTYDFQNSLVQMINNTEADMAAAFIPIFSDLRTYLYYSTTPLDEGEWIMVMQRPRESATGSGLLAPFDFWVWILIIVSLLVVGPIIYLLILLRNKLTGDTKQKSYSLSHCAWFVYGGLMKQGTTLAPIADSTRILFATWWIFITILTSFYTANLTAFLTLSEFTLPYNTVNDILYRQKQFVTHRGGGVEYAIRNTNGSLAKLTKMINNNRVVFTKVTNDTETLHTLVEKQGYVFVRDRPAINHLLYRDYHYRKFLSKNEERIHCPFATAKQPFLRRRRAFAYPHQSNLSQLFDPELLNLVEAGIIKYLSSYGLPKAEICPQNLGGTERQLRVGDLLMTYYIMFSGFATAFGVFTSEMFFRWLNQRCCERSNQRTAHHDVGPTPKISIGPSRWGTHYTELDRSDKLRLPLYGNNNSNITPPPPYQSIYSNKKANRMPNNSNNLERWRQAAVVPSLASDLRGLNGRHTPNTRDLTGVRRVINGRDYIVYRTPNGQSQLVPMRVPSAALFQYNYTE